MPGPPAAPNAERSRALRFIVCLGIVSLFADMVYEGARSVLGPFLQNLGASAAAVGFIAGFGEMVAAALRFFSGRLADRSRAYWSLTILGYGLTAVAVPLLAFALGWPMAFALVVAERAGKSLRGPSRDVLLSGATAQVGHGWGFGLHAALDQTGAVVGPLFVAAMVARTHHYGPALLSLGAPAIAMFAALAVARILFPHGAANAAPPAAPRTPSHLPRVFWLYAGAAGLLACGFADFPLLAFRWQQAGIARPSTIPLLYAAAMGMEGLTALGFGRLFDRYGAAVLSLGTLFSMAALPLAFLGGLGAAVAAIVFWGCGMGAQDACLRSGIARVVSMDKRGRAFGIFNGIFGILWFAGSAIMGLLYGVTPLALVAFGLAMQAVAAAAFLWLGRSRMLESGSPA